MSRLGGGIGTRGPGETQLETDRRRILGRISKLERQLKDLSRSRETKSKARRRARIPLVSVIGYSFIVIRAEHRQSQKNRTTPENS